MSKEIVTVEVKHWYESKTLWVNIAVFVLSAALVVLNAMSEGKLAAPFTVDAGFIGMAITIINMALRLITTQPVSK